ncbi:MULTISPECIES: DUF3613 domain-containing protein [Stenotrophomonas]|uniref:DUF3613 domain-containing protein n=1 Tax=Stenotrophomonas TaxID=40323 RepID=UPI0008727714|nr:MULTISPECIES: DUF3613 domain-containing protein [Stenotrophomonas]OEZ00400.1 hypothetical protein BIY45_11725 [Stenotrophomonas sp. BIIR7]
MKVFATARFAGVLLVCSALGTTTATSAESRPAEVGDATRALLRLQASGERASAPLPILGDQATASYKRYIDSFTHPIPAYLAPNVRQGASGSAADSGK